MSLGPFLRREWVASARRQTLHTERCAAVLIMTVVVAASTRIWDSERWDRASVAAARLFVLSTFGVAVVVEAFKVQALVTAMTAPAIAFERDRKSLDSLLATRLSAAEIVLGTMMAKLLRWGAGMAALLPVAIWFVSVGGVDVRLVALAAVGLCSMAFALAALATAVSATARTGQYATTRAVLLAVAWLGVPLLAIVVVPRLWPAAGRWVAPVAVRVLDSTPMGILLSISRVLPRGPLDVALFRMVGLQIGIGILLLLWAMVRLRPASRALYDVEGRSALRRVLRAKWRPRPPCGDDPVFWRERYSTPMVSDVARFVSRLISLLWLAALAYGTSLFAVPAFAELWKNGYGAPSANVSLPELNPIARVLVNKLTTKTLDLVSGQARLEFNIVLRQVTVTFDLLYVLMIGGVAAESIAAERERDTWLGLITTPLTGWEIVRAKMFGTIWKTRGLGLTLLALWSVGLLAGAVHPLGFIASVVQMAASYAFLAALGVWCSLRSPDRNVALGTLLTPLLLASGLSFLPFIARGVVSAIAATASMPFQTWASLVSYEDLRALRHSRPILQFSVIGIKTAGGTWIVLAALACSTFLQAIAAFLITRAAVRGFDAAVGRPIRAQEGGEPRDP